MPRICPSSGVTCFACFGSKQVTFFSHDPTSRVSIPMYLLLKVCLMILSVFHGIASMNLGATQSSPVALPRFIDALTRRRCAMSHHGGRLPSSFAAREADSSLHNSIVDFSRFLSDSPLSLAYRLSSSAQCSRLTVSPIPSQCCISVKLFVSPFTFSSFCSAIVALCILRCFRTSDRALFQRFGPLPSKQFLCLEVFSKICLCSFIPLLQCGIA